MATTGTSLFGTHLLDVLSKNSNEVAAFGNTGQNAYVRFYDQDAPKTTGYVMGLSNSSFALVKEATPTQTTLGIGTYSPKIGANLHVQGTFVTSNISTYNADNALVFSGIDLTGIRDVSMNGTIYQAGLPIRTTQWTTKDTNVYLMNSNVGIGTTTPQGVLDVRGGQSIFLGNVGIGTTIASSNLTVFGNMSLSGKLVVGEVVDLTGQLGTYNSWNIYNGTNNTKTITTNDTTLSNRVLFSFKLKQGRYIISGVIPFKNLTPIVSVDTVNWATVGLYQATPGTYSDTLQATYLTPLVAIGGDATDYDTVSFNTFVVVSDQNGTDFVVAVNGKGHQLQFGGTGMATPLIYTVPVRGLGTNDSISVRQAIQMNPVRGTFFATNNQSVFSVNTPGTFTATTSNVDVYINGTKYVYKDNNNYDYNLTTNTANNVTTFTINLTQPVNSGDVVELAVWPVAIATDYYTSGYLYQSVTNISTPWLNVVGGGVRTANRLIVDGDLFVQGNIYGGCNTTTFSSGLLWDTSLNSISSNIIGSENIIDGSISTTKIMDGAVATSKLTDSAVTSVKIATGAVGTSQLADSSVTTSKLNFTGANVGIGTNPRARLDVAGSIMTNSAYMLNTSNAIMAYDYTQAASAPIVSFQSSNVQLSTHNNPILRVEAKDLALANSSLVANWGVFSQGTALNRPTFYNSGGYNNGSFVQFTSTTSTVLTAPNTTFNVSANGGFTAVALVRFDKGTSGGVGDRIFHLQVGIGNNFIYLGRASAASSTLEFGVNNGTTANTFQIANVITDSNWGVYAVSMTSLSGGYVTIWKNGALIGSTTMTFNITSSFTFTNIPIGRDSATNFADMSFGGLIMYDRTLPAEQMQTVTDYFMQGWSVLPNTSLPVLQTNPVPYASTNYGLVPAYNLEANANLKVHSLPTDPMWVVDLYSPSSLFVNSVATRPNFNLTTGGIEFTAASSHQLDLGPRFYNFGSKGLTFVTKFKFTGSPTSNDRLLWLGFSSLTQEYITLRREALTQNLSLVIRSGGGITYTVSTTFQFIQEQTYVVAARIDPVDKGTVSIWVNGTQHIASANVGATSFGAIIDKFFQYSALGTGGGSSLNGTIYTAALYNRTLTDTELRQAYTTLTTDTPITSLEVGSRTGRNALTVSKEGYITPFVMQGTDAISGLVAYLPFENHIYDVAGTNLLGAPSVTGNIQFNSIGRVGESVCFMNKVSANNPSTLLQYPLNNVWTTNTLTVSLWIKRYTTPSLADSTVLNIRGPFADPPSLYVICLTTGAIRFGSQYASTSYTNVTSSAVSNNVWHHVVGIMNASGTSLYVNGSYVGVQAASISPIQLRALLLGGRYTSTENLFNQGFHGEIDDVRIYNRELSVTEIQALYNTPTCEAALQIRGTGGNTTSLNATSTLVEISGPLQLADGVVLDNYVTNTSNLTSTLQYTTNDFQLIDLTGTQGSISTYGGVTQVPLVQNGPFPLLPDEGAILLPGRSGSYIQLTNSAYQFNWWQSGGFTLECWVNYQSFVQASRGDAVIPGLIGLQDPSTNTSYWAFGATSGGRLAFYYLGQASLLQGTTTMSTNTWCHIAVACDATNTRIFLNGNLEGTLAIGTPTALALTTITLGNYNTSGGANAALVNAYIAGINLIQGAALYTSTFTPPSTPPALSNSGTTRLLLRNMRIMRNTMSLTSTGNLAVAGNVSAGNLGLFRNRIINGDVRIDQRGGVTATSTQNVYGPDRFRMNNAAGNGTVALTKVAVTDLSGFTNALQASVSVANTTASTSATVAVQQIIEGYNIADLGWGTNYGQSATVSFWVKITAFTGATYPLKLGFGLTNNAINVTWRTTYTVNAANTWQYVSFSVPPEVTKTWLADNGIGLYVSWMLDAITSGGTTYLDRGWIATTNWADFTGASIATPARTAGATIQFTGLQFEKGTIATPFEFRPYATELQLCQRYCQRFTTTGVYGRFAMGIGNLATQAYFPLQLPTPIRTTVTNFTISSAAHFLQFPSSSAITAIQAASLDASTQVLGLATTTTGLTSGAAYMLYANNTASAWIQVESEL
jgi:hypothetical protein